MNSQFHSVTLIEDKCKGCTTCIKHCPTEAIRVRNGKARILDEKCIDCGECIRRCPNHAKTAIADNLSKLKDFSYTIALPAPSLYAQFPRPTHTVPRILAALIRIGFDDVYEVAHAAEYVSLATAQYLRKVKRRPLISAACPAVVRLVQVRFPDLLPHLIQINAPVDAAARIAKQEKSVALGLPESEIGVCFITPCPAKVTAIKQPLTGPSFVDMVVPISEIYGLILRDLNEVQEKLSLQRASSLGINWGRAGGEVEALGSFRRMSVDGIHSVISLLEEVELGKLADVDFLECQACVGGCVGGALTVENPHVGRLRLKDKAGLAPKSCVDDAEVSRVMKVGFLAWQTSIKPLAVMQLNKDLATAIKMADALEKTLERLPGLDCGSCGSPSCQALAEDIVRGVASENDCVFKLRDAVQAVAEELLELARQVPPSMSKENVGESPGRDRESLAGEKGA